jgi:hypothetical protein
MPITLLSGQEVLSANPGTMREPAGLKDRRARTQGALLLVRFLWRKENEPDRLQAGGTPTP